MPNGQYDVGEVFVDIGDGVWNFTDLNNNQICDQNVVVEADDESACDTYGGDWSSGTCTVASECEDFTDLGKNYKKLKWDQINYSALSEDSKKAIDWTEINPKLASHAETFSLDTIDWDEISSHKVEVELYKLITEAMLEEASKETLSKLNTDLLNENNLLPSSSFFSEIPEPFGNYEILAGSSGTDEITGLPPTPPVSRRLLSELDFGYEDRDEVVARRLDFDEMDVTANQANPFTVRWLE